MNVLLCIATLIGLKFTNVVSQSCPNRWLERPDGDSCYRLWPSPLKTWDEARAACQVYGGELLKLDSQEEKDWIITEIIKFPASYEWWIGLNNKEDVNTWVWADGSPRNDTFILWGSGEPNNYRGEERCAEIWDNLLNDKNCRQPLQYICERRKDLPLKCDVDNGWSSLTPDYCYKLFDKKHTFESAEAECSIEESTLLTNIDETSQQVVSDFIQGDGQESVWLGLKYRITYPTGFDWKWRTGDSLSSDAQWWNGGRPEDERVQNESLSCVVLNSTLSSNGNWVAVRCDEEFKFVCKKPQGTCPTGWSQHQSTCYSQISSRQFIWNEARGHCNLQGASLLEIKGKSDRSYLESVVKKSNPRSSVWIGLYGTIDNRQWNSGKEYSYFDIEIERDETIETNQNGCVYISPGSSKWQLGDCGILQGVICTVPVNTPVIQLPSLQPIYVCPFSWLKRENLCYLIRYDVLSWLGARKACQDVGGDLVTMNDKDTLDYIADLVNQEIWIGLSDRATDNAYVWLDTTHTPSSTFWKKEELNGHVIGGRYLRNCVAMINRKWVTYPCSFKLGYVCQRRAEYNIAPGKHATQSSVYETHGSEKAIEGCSSRNWATACCSHTNYDMEPWWEMDMGTIYEIGKIMIQRRYEGNCEKCKERLHNFRIFLSNSSGETDEQSMVFQDTRLKPPAEITINLLSPVTARYVRIDIPDRQEYLTLCEVQVFQAKDVYSPILSPTNSNCYTDSLMWNGSISHTVTGKKCQEWIKDTPHKHNYHIDDRYPEGSQKAAKSFCRDPDRDGTPWCYTLDPETRWEYCGIPQCAANVDKDEEGKVTDENCGAGWKENPRTGRCYRSGDEKLCWSDAVSACDAYGGTLFVIQDAAEYNFIKDSLSEQLTKLGTEDLWMGLHDTVPGTRWKSVAKNMDLSSLPLSHLAGEVKNSNCVATKLTGKWYISDCAVRMAYVCERGGKYKLVFTGQSQKAISISNKNIIDITETDTMQFGFKGAGSATILLQTGADSVIKVYKIIIGGDKNTRSMIRTQQQTKYTSFEKNLLNESEFRQFWVSWKDGNIKVGKGSIVESTVFMDWSEPDFATVTDVSIASGDENDGYWRFGERKDKKPVASTDAGQNIALEKETHQSSLYPKGEARKAVDGCASNDWGSGCCTHTNNDFNPWWQVDLGRLAVLKEITIYRRWDCNVCKTRMNGFRVFVTSDGETSDKQPVYTSVQDKPGPIIRIPLIKGTLGRYVKIDVPGREDYLTLCEVEVIEDPDTDLPLCGPDWTVYHEADKCFRFLDERRTWDQARERCAELEGALAPISSAEEQLFMFEKVRKFSAMGLWFDSRSKDNTLQMSNGSLIQYKDSLTFSSLWPGHRGDCYSLLIEWDYGNGMWVDFDCSAGIAFVCTKSEQETTTISTTTTTTTAVTTTVPLVDNTGCPEGWIKNARRQLCFQIFREFADWYTARDKCKAQNGQLAQFLSTDDQEYFKAIILQYFITTGKWDGIWIDGHDLKEEGIWKLSSGDPLPVLLNWWPGQPDDYESNEDCLGTLTSFERAGMLNDAPCSYRYKGYICQTALPTCEDGWTNDDISGNCYKIFTDKLRWGASQTACIAQDAQLASITSSREQDFLTGLTVGIDDEIGVWVGAHDITTESMWVWADGEPWFDGIRWGRDQPDNWQGYEDCGMLRLFDDQRGLLNDIKCTQEMSYMCKKKATVPKPPGVAESTSTATEATTTTAVLTTSTTTGTTTITTVPGSVSVKCGSGWEESSYSDFCYQFNTDTKPFFDAFSACLDQNALLTSIVTPQEQAYISGRIASDPAFNCDVWLGLTTDIPGWIDNAPLVYFNWAPGEPNIETPGPAAISLNKDSYMQWKILPDKEKHCYICKREGLKASNTTTTVTPVPVTTTVAGSQYFGCPAKGWIDYKSSCYLLIQEKKDWKGALKYCRKQGADLASIGDKEENDFIYSQLPKDYCFNIWPNNTECTLWAETGECEKNPTWMAKQCHHACNLCYHDCRDKYIPEKCMEWAKIGECDANPKWMHPNCAQSCGICYGAPTRGFWIGMTKRTHSQVYSWTDLSKPTFTLWAKSQPTNFASTKPSCVAIFLQTGTWNDGFCDDLLSGLVCKQPKRLISATSLSPFRVGCSEENSLGYDWFCYTYMKEKATWNDAESACAAKGGSLAAVTDRFIQAFVSSELFGRTEDYWIGLRSIGSSVQWSTGQELEYAHFEKEVPAPYICYHYTQAELNQIGQGTSDSVVCESGSGRHYTQGNNADYHGCGDCWCCQDAEQCHVMSSRKPIGLWQARSCSMASPYICQTPREGYTTPTPTTPIPTTPVPCPSPWEPFEGYCYLASTTGKTESWYKAEEICRNFGGNIASTHSSAESTFLVSLFSEISDEVSSIWIGINDHTSEGSFVWTDGSSVSYSNWAYNEPNNAHGREHCGEMAAGDSLYWNDNMCYLSRHYVCKIPRGFAIPTTASPTATTDDKCGDGWILFKSNCYFNGGNDIKSWHDARQFCSDKGADLASIHDEEEDFFIVTLASKNEQSAWIGLNDLNLDGSFQWSDGQAANFFLWRSGEPNDYHGSEKCVDLDHYNGQWNDLNCNLERSFICKHPVDRTVTQRVTTTSAPEGGCYTGFKPFGNKCYYVSDGEPCVWGEAKAKCEGIGPGSRLVSIHTRLEQAYLVTKVLGKSNSYWIGLNDINGDNAYDWIDNSPVAYTNWDQNAPRSQLQTKYPCVAMMNLYTDRPGAWINYQCTYRREFLCVSPKLPSLPTATPATSEISSDCQTGYQPFGDYCYKLMSQRQTWFQANASCQAENAELSSVTDHYEQAFVEVLAADSDESIWIGLLFSEDGSFVWIDNKTMPIMLLETNGIPDASSNKLCGAVVSNTWVMKDCMLMLKSVCKMPKVGTETTTVPSTPSSTIQTFRYVCNQDCVTYKEACYYIMTEDKTDFQTAQDACRDRNMTLASIHSKEENDRVQEILGGKVRNEVIQTVWIGLKKVQWKAGDKDHAYYLWTDGSAVTYMDKVKHDGSADDLNMQYGYMEFRHHWNIGSGSKKLGYICKGSPDVREEITTPTTTTPKPPTSQSSAKSITTSRWSIFPFTNRVTPKLPPFHQVSRVDKQVSENSSLSGGQVAGVIFGILGFLVIVSVIVYVVWKNWKPALKYRPGISLGFDNALFHRTSETVSLSE